jgi:hypothetical protein
LAHGSLSIGHHEFAHAAVVADENDQDHNE